MFCLDFCTTILSLSIRYGSGDEKHCPVYKLSFGLVARLQDDEDLLFAVLRSARSRVGGRCGRGEDTSCYGCLRSYRNQFAHNRLKRGPVLAYLDEIARS